MAALLEKRVTPGTLVGGTSSKGLEPAQVEYLNGLAYELLNEEQLDLPAREGHLLTMEEEQFLFEQMHLAFFQAAQCRELVLENPADEAAQAEMQRLLQRGEAIRNRIVEAFWKLNLAVAGRFTSRENCFDELVSEGYYTMLRAIAKFNPERGFRFSTYAMHAIRRRLVRFVRGKQKQRQSVMPFCEESPDVETGRWTEAYERRVVNAVDTIERLLPQLSPRERYVVRSRFGWGREFEPRTLQEIADELGVSRERIRQLEQRSLKKLRKLVQGLHVEL